MSYKYVGGKWGGFIPGYPRKDLTEGDIERLRLDRAVLDSSPLYEKVAQKRATRKAKEQEDGRIEESEKNPIGSGDNGGE